VITEATGDGDNIHEYVPPPPRQEKQTAGVRRPVAVIGLESTTRALNPMELYTEGLCPTCFSVRGERTEVPVKVDAIDSYTEGTGARTVRWPMGKTEFRLVSERFLDALTDTERKRLSVREAERTGRGRKKFFEILGSKLNPPRAALKRPVGSHDLWRCATCGWENEPAYDHPRKAPDRYVSLDDLPSRMPSLFLLGRAPDHDLCFTRERWEELVGSKATAGMKSYDGFVIDAAQVDPNPPRRRLVKLDL
jgi:hypothetical protein